LRIFDSEVSFNTASNLAYTAGVTAVEFNLVEIRRCRFEGNVGRGLGGGGFGSRSMIVTDCEFIGNRATAGAGMQVTPQISLLVSNNLFLRNVATAGSGGGLSASESPGTITFNTFAFDSCLGTGVGGGIRLSTGFSGALSGNTFYGCYCEASAGAAAVEIDGSATVVSFSENVLTGSEGAPALLVFQGTVTGGCNAFWDNALGDFGPGSMPVPTDIFADPLFCDPMNLDFTLNDGSPCAPGGTPGCGQIGAHGVGCGVVSVEAASWGKIKSLYR
jgi:hypothetical protein